MPTKAVEEACGLPSHSRVKTGSLDGVGGRRDRGPRKYQMLPRRVCRLPGSVRDARTPLRTPAARRGGGSLLSPSTKMSPSHSIKAWSLRKIKKAAQGHTARMWQSHSSNQLDLLEASSLPQMISCLTTPGSGIERTLALAFKSRK